MLLCMDFDGVIADSLDYLLDVAAGPGTLALQAARRGARVTATDFSPAMVETLRARASSEGLSGITTEVADGQNLPFPNASFDVACSMFGLFIFPDRARGFAELGITPTAMEAVLPEYLWRYRPSGQYAAIKDSAKNLKKA